MAHRRPQEQRISQTQGPHLSYGYSQSESTSCCRLPSHGINIPGRAGERRRSACALLAAGVIGGVIDHDCDAFQQLPACCCVDRVGMLRIQVAGTGGGRVRGQRGGSPALSERRAWDGICACAAIRVTCRRRVKCSVIRAHAGDPAPSPRPPKAPSDIQRPDLSSDSVAGRRSRIEPKTSPLACFARTTQPRRSKPVAA